MVEPEHPKISVREQAKLLGINRSTLYYQAVDKPNEEEQLKNQHIDRMYTDHPVYGTRRITTMLRRDGWDVNRKRVQRYMREMGIAGICPGPNLSKRNLQHKVCCGA